MRKLTHLSNFEVAVKFSGLRINYNKYLGFNYCEKWRSVNLPVIGTPIAHSPYAAFLFLVNILIDAIPTETSHLRYFLPVKLMKTATQRAAINLLVKTQLSANQVK